MIRIIIGFVNSTQPTGYYQKNGFDEVRLF